MKKPIALTYKGRPAKIEKSTINSRFWVLKVKNANGKWVKENVSDIKCHLEGICKFS